MPPGARKNIIARAKRPITTRESRFWAPYWQLATVRKGWQCSWYHQKQWTEYHLFPALLALYWHRFVSSVTLKWLSYLPEPIAI